MKDYVRTPTSNSQLPHVPIADLVLEGGALGAAMLLPVQAEELIRDGYPSLFTTSMHRDIYHAISSLGPDQLDYTLLYDELERQGHAISFDVLVHLDDGVVTEIRMARRIERLKELHRLRQLASLGQQLSEQVYLPGACSTEIVRILHERLAELAR
jgi:replicative DNA helicase